jgi:hypothetical protein
MAKGRNARKEKKKPKSKKDKKSKLKRKLFLMAYVQEAMAY